MAQTEKQKEYSRTYREKNRDKLNAYQRANSKKNAERSKAYIKAWIARNPEKYKVLQQKRHFKLKYGITLKEYEDMVCKQKGVCKICLKPEMEYQGRLHVDHDHSTGKIRGLLCRACNHGVGNFKDSPELLKAAILYLSQQ